jgi:hypothetical protein
MPAGSGCLQILEVIFAKLTSLRSRGLGCVVLGNTPECKQLDKEFD